jgi:RNA polymerase sigma-70 factor, ECF subfamily
MCPKPDTPPTDESIIRRILDGETGLYEIIMQRYNQRLYRVALSIVGDPAEAEDVVQDAWVQAWFHLHQFAGEAKFSTWLTRIAVRAACARRRRQRRRLQMTTETTLPANTAENPERRAIRREAEAILESAIRSLRPGYRSVFMLREIEGLSISETAECLEIKPENVKIRLHRARKMLEQALQIRTAGVQSKPFSFLGLPCERTRLGAMRRIGISS